MEKMLLTALKQKLLDLFFPQFCLHCSREGRVFCDDCFSLLEINHWQYCPFCSYPQRVIGGGRCFKHADYKLDGLFSAVSYKSLLVKKLIGCFKYPPYLKTIAPTLSQIIIAYFLLSENQIIFHSQPNVALVPIPLFRAHQKKRGYNQSQLIAQELAKAWQIPLLEKALIKQKTTPKQVGLNREQRQKNIQGAFLAPFPELIKNKKLFLIDDVFTTGSTMEEAAKTLKRAGAQEVWGIAVARE
jgi:ComF family protein